MIEQPKEEITTGPTGGVKTTHPSFAMVGWSRVSGHATLFGSDFTHQHFVRLRIKKACVDRSLSHDWYRGNLEEYVEVDMSEAQWATFVSSPNVGDGVPCTLRYLNGQEIPELPNPVQKDKQFVSETKKHIDEALMGLKDLRKKISEMNVSQKKKDELLGETNRVEKQISQNAPFVMECFGEHMEKVVEKAKIEVSAYATSHLMQLGLEAVQEKKLLAFAEKKE